MTTYIDRNYFHQLAEADPVAVGRNGRCRYEPVTKRYSLTLWGEEYIVDGAHQRVERPSTLLPAPHEYFYLFVIFYLLSAKDIETCGEWISEKDLPGGPTFFRGPHLIPTELISDRFGNDLDGFKQCCEKLGGTALDLGDAAFRFEIAREIPVVVVYWLGDEDFPAEAGLLYDRSIGQFLPLDILFALAVAVCSRIGATAERTTA